MTKLQLVTLLMLLSACPRTPEREQEGDHHDHEQGGKEAASAEKHGHDDDLTRVHVQEGMLRDLHLTTGGAHARAAGDTVSALGELRVNEDRYAEVGTAIDARVARVFAAPGDVVKQGQPLVELESLDVGRARAALASAEARQVLARSTLERKRALVGERIVAPRDVQSAEAEVAHVEAEQRAATDALSALGAAGGRGARFVLGAPLAGTVLERSVLPGRRVDDSRPLFIVADVSTLWLVVHAFERDALRVREGAVAEVTFAALPGRSFTGRVARIGTHVDSVSRTVDVRVDLENADGVLKPGMSASARIGIGEQNATIVTVPTHAVQRVGKSWAVFLPTAEPGAFEIREVGRGRDLNGEVEIINGLRAAETVVIDGAFLLKAQVERARGGGEEHHH